MVLWCNAAIQLTCNLAIWQYTIMPVDYSAILPLCNSAMALWHYGTIAQIVLWHYVASQLTCYFAILLFSNSLFCYFAIWQSTILLLCNLAIHYHAILLFYYHAIMLSSHLTIILSCHLTIPLWCLSAIMQSSYSTNSQAHLFI